MFNGEPERVRGAPTSHDEARAAAPQVARQLRHEPEVSHRRADRAAAAAAPRVADVGSGDELELPVAIQRALRQAGRARREHDRDGAVGVIGERRRRLAGRAQLVEHRVGTPRRRHRFDVGDTRKLQAGTREHQPRRSRLEERGLLLRREAVVHPRRDRAELGRREVRGGVLGRGR